MPFVSPRQERFMWAKHPDIARRWATEYGSFKQHQNFSKSPHSESSESPAPKIKALPRLPGVKRDFTNLHPGAVQRHPPPSKHVPNEFEAMREFGVQFLHGSGHRELGTPKRLGGLRGHHQRRFEAMLSPKQRGHSRG